MQTSVDAPRQAKAILQFLPAWTVLVSGQLRAGRAVLIEYDPTRLVGRPLSRADGAPPGEVVAHVHVHPGGQELTQSLLQSSGGEQAPLERPQPWVNELDIPEDATALEVWFRLSSEGSTTWDTRFGANYWFDVAPAMEPATIPFESVAYRWGAVPRLDLVHVVSEHVSKERTVASPHALSIETRLFVQVWTRGEPVTEAAWVDIHVFDESNGLVHSETLALDRTGPAESGGEFFVLDRPIHEGSSLAAPGSVARARSESVRKLQYRLYCQMEGQTFTDGLLHQHDLIPDASTHE